MKIDGSLRSFGVGLFGGFAGWYWLTGRPGWAAMNIACTLWLATWHWKESVSTRLTAAPDMLASMEETLSLLEFYVQGQFHQAVMGDAREKLDRFRAVIRKARGQL